MNDWTAALLVSTLLCLTSFAGSSSPAPALTPADNKVMQVEDVLDLKRVGELRMSPDGRWVAYVVTRRDFEKNINDSDLFVVSTGGGEPVRLTYHSGRDASPIWSPDSSWLAFLSDRVDKKSQVFGIFPDGGEAWPVTQWKQSVNAFRFSPDGKGIAFLARAEKGEEQKKTEKLRGRPILWGKAYDDQWARLWAAELEDRRAGEAVQISGPAQQVSAFVWGPDSRRVAYAARPSPVLRTFRLGAVFAADRAGGNSRKVADLPGGESPVSWTREGLIISGSGKELGTYNNQLWRVPEEGGDPVSLTSRFDENAGFVAAASGSLLVEATARTSRQLYRISLGDGSVESLGDQQGFTSNYTASRDGSKVAFLAEGWDTPPDVHVRDLDASTPARRLTEINPQAADFRLGEQKVLSWRSRADGEGIEGVLTLPVDYRAGTRAPLLLVIHGGPSGVSSNRFTPARGAYPIQVFAGLGYAVLQPNYRGSTGYGQRFRGLNRGDISGRDWTDIDSGVDAMIEQGIADPGRLGIMGWSFGGHHTFWGITQTDRFQAASAGAGANDLISMYSQTDIPEFYHTYLGPKPWEDFALYEERSAYRYVMNVTTPLLIQVGEKDERVPAEQSIQFYEALKAIGKAPTELVLYPDQPHGVRDPRLYRDLITRNVEWFGRHIPTGPPTEKEP